MRLRKPKQDKILLDQNHEQVITNQHYNDDRTMAFKVSRTGHRADSIAWVVGSFIMFIFLTLSVGRLTIVGELIDDTVFSFLFGWLKYVVYLLLFITNIFIVFGLSAKFKVSFLGMFFISWLVLSWMITTIYLLAMKAPLWANDMFSVTMKDYISNWKTNSIFGPAFLDAQPQKFLYWHYNAAYINVGQAGGVIGALLAGSIGYASLPGSLILASFALMLDLIWIMTGNPFYFFLPKKKRHGKRVRALALKHNDNPYEEIKVTRQQLQDPYIEAKPASDDTLVTIKSVTPEGDATLYASPNDLTIHDETETFEFHPYEPEVEPTTPIEPTEYFTIQQPEKEKPKLKSPTQVFNERKAEFENLNDQEVREHFAHEYSDIRPYGNLEPTPVPETPTDLTQKFHREVEVPPEPTFVALSDHDDEYHTQTIIMDEPTADLMLEELVETEPAPDWANETDYLLPPIELLDDVKQDYHLIIENQQYALEKKKAINSTFQQFNVGAEVVNVVYGPTVMKFEIQPGPGTKVNSISSLENDLKLALASQNIRIEAPIPGKNLVGIEIANKHRLLIGLKEMMSEANKKGLKNKLLFPLGKDVQGNAVFADLQKMPHLLIAGSTGSGKSVMINTLIISLIMRAKPSEVKLLLIDPKKVELGIYKNLPHMLTPVISDMKKANEALRVIITEMDRRYALFADSGARNLESYNKKQVDETKRLPYYVVIIDELADLMMTANRKEVEDSIMRLTQMARAAGIHLVLATQRPSVDVLTGVIKANVPARIAFSVATGTDSRTILDSVGAEKLTGKGDMLYISADATSSVRAQGAYLSDDEIDRIVEFIQDQLKPHYQHEFEAAFEHTERMGSAHHEDMHLYEEVKSWVIANRKVSTNLLQRKFSLGYNRAANLMDQLEAEGIIGPQQGSKPRTVLV